MTPSQNDGNAKSDRNLFEDSKSLEDWCLDEQLLEKTLAAYSNAIAERNLMARQLRETLKQLSDLKFALERAAKISVGDRHSIINFLREQFGRGYRADSAARKTVHPPHDLRAIESVLAPIVQAIDRRKVWHGTIELALGESQIARYYTTVVPFSREPGQPDQFLALQVNLMEGVRIE
ncbi:hypothetical protein [Oxynema aestuarii]|uniref:Uncharacterized protein n=1 Tax=Oxynema aestuarii AP17 TaxID=2064643 RepID=A0A6H1TWS2_9CYAN|nr:hypothetical protein [Oxynema aestuarii]QIZ70656.1 hypothetical protein HCG48_08755 [Oxynema aestuarii AP17]RMH76225.1 MAG: hypothetical protein D6680_09100 [Cyanobacteria bacterium J007]